MPTRGRADFVEHALECWHSQDHADKELVIVDDADAPTFKSSPAGDGIVYLLSTERHTVGAKRNLCCELAAGSVICHWDDDDHSEAWRLSSQIKTLDDSGLAVTGYCNMEFTDGAKWWRYAIGPHYALGTSLMYLRSWWEQHRFPDTNKAEDKDFVFAAAAVKQLESVDCGGTMWASIHRNNTSQRTLGTPLWRQIERRGTP